MRKLAGSKIVIATHNKGKLEEFAQLLAPYGVETVSAGQLGLAEPEETETTFEGNARIMATAAMTASGLIALADDSGLCVEALNGEPGVYTADWAGPDRDWNRAMRLVEEKLQARHVTTPDQRRANSSVHCASCGPTARSAFSRPRQWPPCMAAARDIGHGYDRCSCRLAAPDLRRDRSRREEQDLAPRQCPGENWSVSSLKPSASMCIGRSARPSAHTATSTASPSPAGRCDVLCPRAENELAWFAARTPGRTVTSIFFGGARPR